MLSRRGPWAQLETTDLNAAPSSSAAMRRRARCRGRPFLSLWPTRRVASWGRNRTGVVAKEDNVTDV